MSKLFHSLAALSFLALLVACRSGAPGAPTGTPRPEASLRPDRSLTLAGRVMTADGRPIAGALVVIRSKALPTTEIDEPDGRDRFLSTDANGKFRAELALSGDAPVNVGASEWGYAYAEQQARAGQPLEFRLAEQAMPAVKIVLQAGSRSSEPMIRFLGLTLLEPGNKPLPTDLLAGREPAWSPDGSQIAFVRDDGLYVSDWAKPEPHRILAQAGVSGPRWSPDGKQLVFERELETFNFEIFKIGADGSGLLQLTRHPASDSSPTWTSDGKLLFVSNRDAPVEPPAPGVLVPKGSGFYVRTEVYRMKADGSDPKRLTDNGVIDGAPAMSPAGDHIAFLNGGSILSLMGADGSGIRQLADQNSAFSNEQATVSGTVAGRLSWSRDGRWILATRRLASNRSDLFVFSSSGPALYRLTSSGDVGSADWYQQGD
ncbi:MAG: hypothetical protein ACAI44_03610 [Candidatus Sericytochromatia bacterium]